MVAVLRVLALPFLFILPWLLMKLSNRESFIRGLLDNQPVVAGALLLPGVIISILWVVKLVKK